MRPRARRTALGLLPGIGEKSPGTAPLRRSAKPKTPRAHRRSESQPALARPWPARQTGSKGRLKFLYPPIVPGRGGPTAVPCHIQQIRPLDVRALRAAEREARAASAVQE